MKTPKTKINPHKGLIWANTDSIFPQSEKKKTSGCAIIALVGIAFVIIIGSLASTDSDKNNPQSRTPLAKTSAPETIYHEEDTIEVGYTTYVAWKSYWTDRLTNNPYAYQAVTTKSST